MYFGSVKFFKHLIYTIIIGVIILAIASSIFFGIMYLGKLAKCDELETNVGMLESELSAANDKIALDSKKAYVPASPTIDDFYLLMSASGYTATDVMEFFSDNETDELEEFFGDELDRRLDEYLSTLPVGTTDSGTPNTHDTSDYSYIYPDVVVEPPSEYLIEKNTVYLTFDDGPSENTVDILKILDKYDIKATFFVVEAKTERQKEIMRQIVDEGHTIGIHSISHVYNKIYASVESYLEDLCNTYNHIYEVTGVKPNILRFPGGSINNYNRLIYHQIIAEVTRRGFVYYDWNVSGEDATRDATWTTIYNNIVKSIENSSTERAIVLLHDSGDKDLTVTTVEDIIQDVSALGYSFKPLNNNVKPINFSYRD